MEPVDDVDTVNAPDAVDPEAARHHRAKVWGGAERTLWRTQVDGPVGPRLRELADWAESSGHGEAPLDSYGDGLVEELEGRVAEELGMPAAVFFPTGTMAQQVALRCWAGRTGNPVVALHPLAHPEVHEGGALGAVSGLRTVHPTDAPRLPTAEEVRDHPEPFGTLMLELPLRDAGFVLPTWEELTEVVAAARERDAVVHFDGARLWECPTHFGRPLAEIAGLADSVYVSFYKSLGGMSGAVLAGPEDVMAEARVWRHRYGGQVFQQYPAALTALRGLDVELPRLPSYVAHARVVADAVREALTEAGLWFRVHPEAPHTHQFQVWLPYDPDTLTAAALAQTEATGTALFRRWFAPGAGGPPGVAVTELTVAGPGLEWTAEDVRAAVRAFLDRIV
ncbi:MULTISPECIES: threonine aldolase family protein [Streptomyces]|uniref:L-allo-threonine aldolase n=1 Tax=Streptomyces venezuelae (strain ATCC 10712 / CBS 650.69 / DSM 40230 / JCM 4526 / NBRC 13096 / PD 04745) TaxID=953739 RepID=F2R961_STRVP|nr:beta-eliminating lyase-related protein [Streptomyces venezuelae]APE22356.1 threonine aldolase [Streptomyces venezuelae]QER99740.1 threonine aldolase [Streptomyces venezuelae ATCC 10712]CCA56521.1 L-allo-threonine aldolase [Streptomyces venezuelae ATCC 10712]